MAKHLIQAALAAAQVVGKAFVKAVRQEIAASQAAAARHGGGRQGAEHSATNSKLGMTLDEAKQILNVKELTPEDIQKNYEYLFKINDKAQGGSLYLQSKMSGLELCRPSSTSSAALPNSGLLKDAILRANILTCTAWTPSSPFEKSTVVKFAPVCSVHQNLLRKQLNATKVEWTTVKYFSSEAKEISGLTFETVLSNKNRERYLENIANAIPSRTRVKMDKIVSGFEPRKKEGTRGKTERLSSVLIALCHVGEDLSLLYTLRSSKLLNHRGEVSFPGGMMDDCDDNDPVKTALRETHEEIGIDPSTVDVWGPTPSVPRRKGDGDVHGVLGYLGKVDVDSLVLNPSEVSRVFTVPLKDLCDPKNFGYTQFRGPASLGGGYSIPLYRTKEEKVWGLTAMFTHMTLRVLLPGLYKHNMKFIPRI